MVWIKNIPLFLWIACNQRWKMTETENAEKKTVVVKSPCWSDGRGKLFFSCLICLAQSIILFFIEEVAIYFPFPLAINSFYFFIAFYQKVSGLLKVYANTGPSNYSLSEMLIGMLLTDGFEGK